MPKGTAQRREFADGFVGKCIRPFWIEDEARKTSAAPGSPGHPGRERQRFRAREEDSDEDNTFRAYAVTPVMMYCGADASAKRTVGALIAELGWDPLDVGGLEQALHLEHMTLLTGRPLRI